MSDLKNWKCKECGHVCGSRQGIISHWGYELSKGKGHKGKFQLEQTSEPKINSGGWDKRGKGKRKKKNNTRKILDKAGTKISDKVGKVLMNSAEALVIFPLIVKGNQVIHPGSIQIVEHQNPEKSSFSDKARLPLLEGLFDERN